MIDTTHCTWESGDSPPATAAIASRGFRTGSACDAGAVHLNPQAISFTPPATGTCGIEANQGRRCQLQPCRRPQTVTKAVPLDDPAAGPARWRVPAPLLDGESRFASRLLPANEA